MFHFHFQCFKHLFDCLHAAVPHWADESAGKAHRFCNSRQSYLVWIPCSTLSGVTDGGKAGYPTLKRLHVKTQPRLGVLYIWYPVDPATRLGGLTHLQLSCKHDQDKMRDYMDRGVAPSRWVTSPTWGPPPPRKQALEWQHIVHDNCII